MASLTGSISKHSIPWQIKFYTWINYALLNRAFLLRIGSAGIQLTKWHTFLLKCPILCHTTYMINYTVFCPYAPDQQETLTDAWRATEICLDLAEEFGYAEVRDHFGNMYCDYGNVCQAVEDGVI